MDLMHLMDADPVIYYLITRVVMFIFCANRKDLLGDCSVTHYWNPGLLGFLYRD